MKLFPTLLALNLLLAFNTYGTEVKTLSPDKKNVVTVKLNAEKGNSLCYSVTSGGDIIIADSPLGLAFEGLEALSANLEIVSSQQKTVDEPWKPVYGERSQYTNHYNQRTINFKELIAPFRSFAIEIRAYNEGVAFRYMVQSSQPVTITRELTGFRFKKDYTSWIANRAQAKYSKGSISKTGRECERPYVIEIAQKKYIALGEAALVDFARMKFDRAVNDSLLLLAALDGKVEFKSSFTTPWRYVMIADSPGGLLENNNLILNLNEPPAIQDPSWIKPGKVIREVTLTTAGTKACIDFAAQHRISYVEFDAGWYGAENDPASDAKSVNIDPKRSTGPLDLQEVIKYGQTKGVGIILYVNQKALSRQLDTILPLYRSWGVKGLKYGFVDVGSQKNTIWLHQAIRKAAENRLMLDIHDEYRPTGYSRTYPNLLTQEGIRGDEESPENQHVLITMFTRMLAGAGDHTNCYFAPRVAVMGSHVSQMAKAICIYSPWQFIYWYDRPENSPRNTGSAGPTIPVIAEIPDLAFYDSLPTVWDDTKVLEGKIGKYGTIARRSGDSWVVGSLTDQQRMMTVQLSFLDKNAKYEATIYTDDATMNTSTHVKIVKKIVTSASKLPFDIKSKNGVAIILKKVVL